MIKLTEQDIHLLHEKESDLLLVIIEYLLLEMYKNKDNYIKIRNNLKKSIDIELPLNFIKVGKDVLLDKNWINDKFEFTEKGKKYIDLLKKGLI